MIRFAEQGWRDPKEAPSGQKLIVWAPNGATAFQTLDALGQWRNMMGRPKSPPKYWMMPPAPPAESRAA
jgi:hypothetical protein